jgi:hypothetical protein
VRSSSHIQASAMEIDTFVQHMARSYLLDVRDRRSQPRYLITAEANAQQVDDDNNLTGPSVRAITRDFSVGGISLCCESPLNGKLMVQLTSPSGTELRALAQVLRCEPNGYYFEAGCKFI